MEGDPVCSLSIRVIFIKQAKKGKPMKFGFNMGFKPMTFVLWIALSLSYLKLVVRLSPIYAVKIEERGLAD